MIFHGLFVQPKEIAISKHMVKTMTEERLKDIREHNRLCMANTHQRGALELPLGIPKSCKVEQPRAQQAHLTTPSYKQGDAQYNNGELRIRYQNGHNKYEYHMGFAGRARTAQQMNTGE